MKIALAGDHGGFKLKEEIKNYLKQNNYQFEDFGTMTADSVDYPDYALIVAQKIKSGEFNQGIIICGTGIGISIAANKVPGIRAALCNDSFSAQASREHNDANILALGERVTGPALALNIVKTWLETEFAGGRHQKRVDKITAIEEQYCSKNAETQAFTLPQLALETKQAISFLLKKAKLKEEQILVIGCSTSEISSKKIGTHGSLEIAETLMEELIKEAKAAGIYLAIQGCEHINRALVVEAECAEKYNLEIVNVLPYREAGGALAEKAMNKFENPVTVESIIGHAGIDIGDTLIGMHLKPVVVPVRLPIKKIGSANLTFAITRPKCIGGERAKYGHREEKHET